MNDSFHPCFKEEQTNGQQPSDLWMLHKRLTSVDELVSL